MLQAKTITYQYQYCPPVLENVDFTVHAGEIVGLFGPSGCGKSTLGFILAGFLTPQTGEVICQDLPLQQKGYCSVQMIYQHPEMAINPRWKIRKVLHEGNKEYKKYTGQFGIHPSWLDRYPHELSGGELQRIALVRAMTTDTKYIIADEITASLDAGTQALIWQNILPWAKENKVGILAISHNQNLLLKIADRIDSTFKK